MSARLVFAAALVASLALTSEARAFEVKHSAEGELVRWRRTNVQWTVDRSVRKVAGAQAAIETAVDAWTQRGGAPSLSAGPPDASIKPGFDGKNTIYYAAKGYEPAGVALAVTLLSFDDRTGEVLDADVVLNGKYHLAPVSVDAPAASLEAESDEDAVYDIGRIVAHEMGHALGLSDEHENAGALMYPYVPRSRVLATSPAADDLAGLTQLYGGEGAGSRASVAATEAESVEGPQCSTVMKPGRSMPGAPYVAAALAVAALAVARGRGRLRARRVAAGGLAFAAAALVAVPSASADAMTFTGAAVLPASLHAVERIDASRFDMRAVVTKVSTTNDHGLFRTELELSTTACASSVCPATAHTIVWGGTLDGVRQVIGGSPVPPEGALVSMALDPQTRLVRVMTPIVE